MTSSGHAHGHVINTEKRKGSQANYFIGIFFIDLIF